MSNRIFSEEEVQKLIKRAAELEAERTVSGRGRGENGLTIDELKNIASETGLDPELIEKAATEMDTTSPDFQEKVRVNREEIVSEIWLDRRPDRETMDVLVTELNHLYGTTDELNWWENLWGTHEGKAKVKKTSNTTEWNYKTEAGMYSTRVLMQQRGDRFRIRVSKRQFYGMEWDSEVTSLILVIPIAVLLAVIGGSSSVATLGVVWPGIVTGVLLSFFSYPLMRYFTKRSIEKHKAEVKKTVGQLAELVLQFTRLDKSKSPSSDKSKSITDIEIPDEQEDSKSQPDKLRNNLRE
tara:strand:- start:17613 stop:18500 length:888 start_codon:yes stop_codon:yes gene_type:complete